MPAVPKAKAASKTKPAPRIVAVEGRGEVYAVKTNPDGSVNVTITLPEDCKEQAKVLLGWHLNEIKFLIENLTTPK